jgi:hypothetical protein
MDSASMAAQSDDRHNRQFRRKWMPDPPKRKPCQRRLAGLPGNSELNGDHPHSLPIAAAARALEFAERRVVELERRARLLRSLGLVDASLWPAAVAAALRSEALT